MAEARPPGDPGAGAGSPDDTSGWGERRRRRLAERLAVQEASGASPEQLRLTRRQLRDAERAAAPPVREPEPRLEPRPAPQPDAGSPSTAGPDEAAEPPTRTPAPRQPRRPVVKPPVAARRPDGPPTGQQPAVPAGAPAPGPGGTAHGEAGPARGAQSRAKGAQSRGRGAQSRGKGAQSGTGGAGDRARGTGASAPARDRDLPPAGRSRGQAAEPPVTAPAAGASQPPADPVRDVVPQRASRRRRARGRLLALLLVGALVLAVGGFLVVREVSSGGPGAGTEAPAGAPPQQTLALALADEAGDVAGAALLGTDGTSSSLVLVPSRLLVSVAGGGRVPMVDALDTGDAAVGQALEDVLDVRVDGTWVVTTGGLDSLVDGLGGISVDVSTSVTTDEVAVPAGAGQRLDGAQAVAYATHLGDGEAETARSARLSQVLSGVLAGLPQTRAELQGELLALGGASRTTLPVPELADVLATVGATARAAELGATVLPVQEIPTGGATPLYGLDDAEARDLLASRFADALMPGGPDAVRVLVQNGVGTPGLGEQARSRLVERGFRFVGGGNASTLGRETTVVAIPSDSQRDRDRGAAVADALGLPGDVVAVGQDSPTLADVVVVLGGDFAAEVEGSS